MHQYLLISCAATISPHFMCRINISSFHVPHHYQFHNALPIFIFCISSFHTAHQFHFNNALTEIFVRRINMGRALERCGHEMSEIFTRRQYEWSVVKLMLGRRMNMLIWAKYVSRYLKCVCGRGGGGVSLITIHKYENTFSHFT